MSWSRRAESRRRARRTSPEATAFFFISADTQAGAGQLAAEICRSDRASLGDDGVAARGRGCLSARPARAPPRRHHGAKAALDALRSTPSWPAREHPQLVAGPALGRELAVAFVYSGNGSQWAGMGIAAYRHNGGVSRAFRSRRCRTSANSPAGRSKTRCSSERSARASTATRVAQPLIFAIQSATTAALRARGFGPAAVLGHSVGEVAAAEAAGILDLQPPCK